MTSLNINDMTTSAINSLDPVTRAKLIYLTDKSMLNMENERWKARRWMAWASLLAIITLTACLIFAVNPTTLVALSDVITWSYIAFSAIIGTYMGTSALSYIASMKGRSQLPVTTDELATAITPFDNLQAPKTSPPQP